MFLISYLILQLFIELDEGLVGVSLTYILLLNAGLFQYPLQQQQSTQFANLLTSVQRAFQYADLDPEPDSGTDEDLRDSWPEYGLITCEGASFSHHSTLPYALRKLFLCIKPYEKVISFIL